MEVSADETNTLLNENEKGNKESSGCQWERWIPFYCGFWTYHFGTDMLIASWLFLASSIIWTVIEVHVVVVNTNHHFIVAFNDECTLTCSILFLLGSVYFVYLSYPEELERMIYIITHEDASKLSFTQRYFTGSDFLIGSWFFAFASLPFVIFGTYAVCVEPGAFIGWAYLLASAIMGFALGIWIYASMPENMQKNNGHGSTYFYDKFFSSDKFCCCRATMEKYCKTDILFGMWLFFVMTAALVPFVLLEVIVYPHLIVSWLDLSMTLMFTVGTALMTWASYEGNQETSIVWTFLRCHPDAKVKDED